MHNPLANLRPALLHALVIALVLVPLFWAYYGTKIHDRGVGGDAIQFINTAYNVVHHGTFSESPGNEGPPEPDAMRPPVYPLFLGGFLRAVPAMAADDMAWFFGGENLPQAPPYFKTIKYAQAFLLLLAAFMALYLVHELTGSIWWGEAAFVITAVHPFLYRYVNRYYSELLTAFLIALFTLLLYLCAKRKRRILFVLAGITLGVLTLTKAQWYYIAAPCAAYLLALGLLERSSRRTMFTGTLLFVLCFAAVVLPWKHRNAELFDRSFITERGGTVLDLRSRYAGMSDDEILASFLYWSRTGTIRDVLDGFMEPGRYANLVREQGYYAQALQRYDELASEYPRAVADKLQFDEAARRILDNPWGYVKTLPAITYRGLVDGNLSVFNIAVHALFWVGLIHVLRRRRWEQAAIYLPMVMLVGFNSLVTHNISRYNATGTVVLVAGAVAGARVVWVWWRERRSAQPSRSA